MWAVAVETGDILHSTFRYVVEVGSHFLKVVQVVVAIAKRVRGWVGQVAAEMMGASRSVSG